MNLTEAGGSVFHVQFTKDETTTSISTQTIHTTVSNVVHVVRMGLI